MVGFESLSQQRRSKVLMCPQPTKKMQGLHVPSANREDARFGCFLSQQKDKVHKLGTRHKF
jgi:hypothetical protein